MMGQPVEDYAEVIGRLLVRVYESRSVLRNRTIVEVFRDLGGFIEKLGTGIRRMTAAMEHTACPGPSSKN